MVIEHALLTVKPGQTADFETAFSKAKLIISKMSGFQHLTLAKSAASENTYLLLVSWDNLEDHTEGFRGSSEYKQWSDLLHHFYDPFPHVDYYNLVTTATKPA